MDLRGGQAGPAGPSPAEIQGKSPAGGEESLRPGPGGARRERPRRKRTVLGALAAAAALGALGVGSVMSKGAVLTHRPPPVVLGTQAGGGSEAGGHREAEVGAEGGGEEAEAVPGPAAAAAADSAVAEFMGALAGAAPPAPAAAGAGPQPLKRKTSPAYRKPSEAAQARAEAALQRKVEALKKGKGKAAPPPPKGKPAEAPFAPAPAKAKKFRPGEQPKATPKVTSGSLKCGGLPAAMLPKFTPQQKPRRRGNANHQGHPGYVVPLDLRGKPLRVRTEHGPRGRWKETVKKDLKPGEAALTDCLDHLDKCTPEARELARGLDGMEELRAGKGKFLKRGFKTCAVVGNSAGMKAKKYGEYIDSHDYVMRINILPTHRFRENLGSKVDGRVVSYKMSRNICCERDKYRPDNPSMEYFLWFPAKPQVVAARMRKHFEQHGYDNTVNVVGPGFLKSVVDVFKKLRKEFNRLGYGPFEDWEYMTSGMHAVLGMARQCEVVNIFGFSTDAGASGPYWFTGRAQAPRSGQRQHSWDHERMVYRTLAAAELVNICTP